MRSIGDEVEFKENGIIAIGKEVLQKAIELLESLKHEGLFNALEQGKFGGVKRPKTGGKGLSGVVQRGTNYRNPFVEPMLNRK